MCAVPDTVSVKGPGCALQQSPCIGRFLRIVARKQQRTLTLELFTQGAGRQLCCPSGRAASKKKPDQKAGQSGLQKAPVKPLAQQAMDPHTSSSSSSSGLPSLQQWAPPSPVQPQHHLGSQPQQHANFLRRQLECGLVRGMAQSAGFCSSDFSPVWAVADFAASRGQDCPPMWRLAPGKFLARYCILRFPCSNNEQHHGQFLGPGRPAVACPLPESLLRPTALDAKLGALPPNYQAEGQPAYSSVRPVPEGEEAWCTAQTGTRLSCKEKATALL